MTRRKSKSRAPSAVAQVAWSETFKTVFRMASDDWTPPATVRVRYGVRTWTLSGAFTAPSGQRFDLATRMQVGSDGRPSAVLSEEMRVSYGVRGGK
jgi:lipoprotein-anchoring transpeptidase ErfK/SrfK